MAAYPPRGLDDTDRFQIALDGFSSRPSDEVAFWRPPFGRQRFLPQRRLRIGGKILGIQGHPEFSPEFTDALLQKRGADMPLATTTAAHNSLKKPINRTTCAKWMATFFHSAAQN